MNHEEGLIKTFILPARRQRCLDLLANPKHRKKFTRELAHFKWLNPKFIVPIPPAQSPLGVFKILKDKGAGERCWVVSEDPDMDSRTFSLETALKEVIGCGMGTLISCIPGKLGYFEDEDGRCILEKH